MVTVPAPEHSVIGFIDGVNRRGYITGWSCIAGKPSQRVEIQAYEGTLLVAAGTADKFRSDIRNAGYGDGQAGFSLLLPELLWDGCVHKITVHCEAPGATPLELDIEAILPSAASSGLETIAQKDPSLLAVPSPSDSDDERPAGVYVPGRYVSCCDPYPPPIYHTGGWHTPERDFTWIQGIEATIEMIVQRPKRGYTFMIEVVPNGTGDRLQTLEIFLNYFRLGFYEILKPSTLSIPMPSELFTLRRTRIGLHCRNAVVGTEFGIVDTRRLGIAVCGWCMK